MELALLVLSCLLTSVATSSSDAPLPRAPRMWMVRSSDSVKRYWAIQLKTLRQGRPYLVNSLIFSNGGGLTAARVNKSCPLHVMQETLEVNNGQPVLFFPEDPQDDDIVRLGRRLYAMFPTPTRCTESTVWHLDTATALVTTGGYVSSAGGPHYSRFAISQSGKMGYNLESCPCRLCRMACSSLGVDLVDGRRLLRAQADPLDVVFVRMQEEFVIQSVVMRPHA